jgi:hypothetical protein
LQDKNQKYLNKIILNLAKLELSGQKSLFSIRACTLSIKMRRKSNFHSTILFTPFAINVLPSLFLMEARETASRKNKEFE